VGNLAKTKYLAESIKTKLHVLLFNWKIYPYISNSKELWGYRNFPNSFPITAASFFAEA